MKKILRILVISLFLFSNVNAEERSNKLEQLFTQLKNTKDLPTAQIVEKKNMGNLVDPSF